MTTLSEAFRSVASGEVEHVLLSSVARIVSGGTPKTGESSFWNGDVPWATPKDLSGLDSVEIHTTPRLITEAGLRNSSAELLPANSVLFSSRAPIGLLAINTTPMATNQGFKSFVPDPERLDSRYLFRWLEANRAKLQNMGVGATFKEVSKAIVARLVIPLPSLDEQRRIAAILDKADELRTNRRQALAHLDALTQSIFNANAQELSEKQAVPLAELCESIQTGPFGSLLHREDYIQNGVPLINPMHIVSGQIQASPDYSVAPMKFDELRSYHLQADDIVLARRGEMGRCALVSAVQLPLLCGTGSMIVRPDSQAVSPRYLQQVLSSPSVRRRLEDASQGVTMSNLNGKILSSLKVRMPKLASQREFATRYEAIERLRTSHRGQLNELNVLFASLQDRSFKAGLR